MPEILSSAETLANLEKVRRTIGRAATEAGRNPGEVSLTVVSKTWGADRILPLIENGHRAFGENRVQEAGDKWPDLRRRYPDVSLHLIGSLQSNKAADAVALFDVIETLDREKLAKVFAKLREEGMAVPELLVQVNTGEESQKGGVAPTQAVSFVRWARGDLALPVTGMMVIPPRGEPPAPHFALLHKLASEAGLSRLSMGMSGDYAIAAGLGATDVRVGSAIFGDRQTSHAG